jgi:hypothetical protein
MRKSLLLLMIVASPTITAKGDGKFFVQDKIPAGIPYQRAFLLSYGGHETLILQSKYDLPPSAAVDSLGWIVPVPAVPEIAGGATGPAWDSFWMASRQTQPHLYRISHMLPCAIFGASLAAFLGGLAILLICLAGHLVTRRTEASNAAWGRWANKGALATLLGFFVLLISMPSLSSIRASAGGGAVDVVKEEKAGVYDVKVIRGQDAGAIVEWLKENGFSFDESDRQVFQDYVARGWCFVTAKVHPAAETSNKTIVAQGLAAPLILKFATERPVYPLALTATAGADTQILIYTLSDAKLTCGDRLTLRHARSTDARSVLRSLVVQAESEDWPLLRDVPEMPLMLCKFTGRLTPAQMKRDLDFTAAADNESYRARKIVW